MNNKETKFSLQDEIRELFSRFTDEWPDLAPMNQQGYVPHIDILDEKEHFLVIAEIPGMKVDEIHLTLDKDVLTIEGEKKCDYQIDNETFDKSEISYGHFLREISFREKTDEDQVEATYRDGVLRVKVLKRQGAGKNRRISIQSFS